MARLNKTNFLQHLNNFVDKKGFLRPLDKICVHIKYYPGEVIFKRLFLQQHIRQQKTIP